MTAGFFALVAVAAACSGSDVWGGRPSHLAHVNPPVLTDDGRVLSLRGEWEFSSFRHAIEARDLRYMHEKNFWGEEPEGWKNLRKINVPGCWEAQGVGEPGPGVSYRGEKIAKWSHRHVHVGNGFYRKTVRVPESWRGLRVWLKVGRVQSRGWFWVDGTPVAHVNEAHRALKWEITDLVKPGSECTVLAEVDNSYPFRNTQIYTYHRWGGLIRDVELEATPKDCFMDEVWARGDFDRQVAEVHVEIEGDRGQGTGCGRRLKEKWFKFHCQPPPLLSALKFRSGTSAPGRRSIRTSTRRRWSSCRRRVRSCSACTSASARASWRCGARSST